MTDKYLWLEEVLSDQSINWAKEISHESIQKLKSFLDFEDIENKALDFFGTREKIPYVSIDDKYVYNFWTDDEHIQGIYRRCSIEEYLKTNPDWESVLDLDELSLSEDVKWVFENLVLNESKTRAMVFISPGGSDANIGREFDMLTKNFIPDGFILPESKGEAHWVNDNTLRLCRTFGEDSETDSGYARTIRDWKRGEPLEAAKIIFEVAQNDMMAHANDIKTKDKTFYFLCRVIDFYNKEEQVFKDGHWIKLQLPKMYSDYGVVKNQYIVMLKMDWKEFKIGDVISYDLETHATSLILSVGLNESVYEISYSETGIYIIIDEDVKGILYKITLQDNEQWTQRKLELPANGSIDYLSTNFMNDKFFVGFSSFNQPSTYYYGEGEKIVCVAKKAPSFFDYKKVIVKQQFATSLDGTKIPYFLVHRNDLVFDSTNPTILYGYGGFEVSLKSSFSNEIGSSWLEKGGVWVMSNIRGGGEYGPNWHQSALKENRFKAYEDFFAIAEELIRLKITNKEHLGAMGESNGGLLMGVCYTQRPDLFKAINCGVPLLDMHRYHKLLAGASWMAEYGNPDDEHDGAYIRSISPYQNIKENETYPVIFLNTSTKDDRVHPGHARKFCAKLVEHNHPVYYYENILGGHGGASNFKETAFLHALEMSFFWKYLK